MKILLILLTLIWIVVLLILPIEVYDLLATAVIMLGAVLTGVLVFNSIKQFYPNFKSIFLIAIIVVGLGYLNIKSYKSRRAGLFKQNGKTIKADIVDRKTRHSKSTTFYYIYYHYMVDRQFYTEKDNVDFDVYFNFNLGPEINIDYVEGRPSISRISKSSLIPDPQAHDKFMKWQKENAKKKKALNK